MTTVGSADLRTLVIVGAGGHGRVVLDIAEGLGWSVIGFCDPALTRGALIDGRPILGGDEVIDDTSGRARLFHLGLGSQSARSAVLKRLRRAGLILATLIHEKAIVSNRAKIGAGALIMPGAVINTGASIGVAAIVNTAAVIEHDVVLFEGVQVSPGAVLAGGVQVGAWANIGANATVLPGVRIGEGATIGAGAVVIADAPAGHTLVGVPARVRDRHG